MARASLRDDILDAGQLVMLRAGYTASGIREITAAAAAPKGSFSNHFVSKDAFASEVLDRYFCGVRELVAQTLGDKSLRPRQRLQKYFETISDLARERDHEIGCLIGGLSMETPGHSGSLQKRLSDIFTEWTKPFAACIAEGQSNGDIATLHDPEVLANFLISSWQGALLRMRVDRSSKPLDQFKVVIFSMILGEDM